MLVADRVQCKNGHLWVSENIYTSPSNQQSCRVCNKERKSVAYRLKNPIIKKFAPRHGSVNMYSNHKCRCAECKLEYRKYKAEQYISYKDRFINYRLNRIYGINLERRDELLAQQDGRCAICKTIEPLDGRRFHVDHNHETGVVRGVLCHTCNVSLGLLKEDPVIVRSLLKYLEEKN